MEKSFSGLSYVEPASYFPKELREKYKVGEFAFEDEPQNSNSNQTKSASIKPEEE